MNIVFCFDKNYEQHFGVALTSVILSNMNCHINLYLITDVVDDDLKEKLIRLSKTYDISFQYYTIDSPEKLDNLKVSAHISKAAYYRLLIPDILPVSIDKVLYLDSDLVVKSSLEELYNLEIADEYFLAAHGSRKKRFFNSGVMLLNLKKWREENLSERVIDFALNNESILIHWDQTALNNIVGSDFLPIGIRWNLQVDLGTKKHERHESSLNFDDAKIVHFIGSRKPWYFWSLDKRKKIYDYYLNQSLWSMTKWRSILKQIGYLQTMLAKILKA